MNRTRNKFRIIIRGVICVAALILLLFAAPAPSVNAQSQEKEPVTYTVEFGDTLSEIAASFDTSVARLLDANPTIDNPNLIYIGQDLTIPAADRPPRTAIIAPTNGPAGSEVELQASGFEAYRSLQILIGPEGSEAALTLNKKADSNGSLSVSFSIPLHAGAGDTWIAAIRPENDRDSFLEQSNTFAVTAGAQMPNKEALVYLVALSDGGQRGDVIGCEDSLVPNLVAIDPARDPVRAALEKLLLDEGRFYEDTELYNSLSRSDLAIDRIDVDGGAAYVYLEGEQKLGGVCDVPRFRYQITETVNQFSNIEDAVVFLNGERLFSESDLEGKADLRIYAVQPGDTLSHIAVSFDTSVEALLDLNPQIDRASLIVVGQRFAIPSTDDDNPFVTLNPTNGDPGTEVSFRAENLEPGATYVVGIGRVDSEYDPVEEVISDETGSVTARLTLPEYAEAGEYWVVVLESAKTHAPVISNLFLVD